MLRLGLPVIFAGSAPRVRGTGFVLSRCYPLIFTMSKSTTKMNDKTVTLCPKRMSHDYECFLAAHEVG